MNPGASESFYRELFEDMVDGLAYCQMLFDAHGAPVDFRYVEVSKNFERLTGSRGVTGKTFSEIFPGRNASHPELLEMCGRVLATSKPEKYETQLGSPVRWFLVSVYALKGDFFGVLFQNITDRKQTEIKLEHAKIAARNVLEDLEVEKEALAHAKAKDEALLESLGEGLVAVDNDRKIVMINTVALDMIGWSTQELIGKELTDLPLEDEAGNLIPFDKRPTTVALATGERMIVTYFFVRKDRTRFPMTIMATPIKLNGKTTGLIMVVRDVTREKEIDRAKTEFVSLASHQLRTPLTTISWYTEMLLQGDAGEVIPAQKKYLQEISQGNRRMIDLVDMMLDASRIEMGTFKIEPKLTDVIALAQSVLDEQKPKIEEKKLIVIQELSNDVPLFLTDPKLLRVVFQNILTNAVQYTPPGGTIRFTLSFDEKKNLLVTISDTGYGIPKNQQSQMFTKLFRADNVRDKGIDGTGLGLYMVKSIVENSGGKIWFESKENGGTTFYVTLPLPG